MTKSSKKTTAIWFEMDKETNRLLNLFSELNGRSKRSEAAHRLKLSLENEYKKMAEMKI